MLTTQGSISPPAPEGGLQAALQTPAECAPTVLELPLDNVNSGFGPPESINHDSTRKARFDRVEGNRERWIVTLDDDDARFRRDNPDYTTHSIFWVFEGFVPPCDGRVIVETIDELTGADLSRAEDYNWVVSGHGIYLFEQVEGTLEYYAGAEVLWEWMRNDGRLRRPDEREYRIATDNVAPGRVYYPVVRQRLRLWAEDGPLTFLIEYAPSFVASERFDNIEGLRGAYAVRLSFEPL
jgi:hypothetical protein